MTINLDRTDEQINCYVRSVSGAIATLARSHALSPQLREQLSPGLLGYLTFSQDGEPVAIRGVATVDCADPPDFAFVALDGITLPERRTEVRVALASAAALCTVDDYWTPIGEPVETMTADLSLGGVLIERRPRMGIGPLVCVDLRLCTGSAPIRCNGKVARLTGTHMGVRFNHMSESDRARLAQVLAEHQ